MVEGAVILHQAEAEYTTPATLRALKPNLKKKSEFKAEFNEKKSTRAWADIPQSETLQEEYIVGQAGTGAHSVISGCFITDSIRKFIVFGQK